MFGRLLYWPELADAIDDRVDEMNAKEVELRLKQNEDKLMLDSLNSPIITSYCCMHISR